MIFVFFNFRKAFCANSDELDFHQKGSGEGGAKLKIDRTRKQTSHQVNSSVSPIALKVVVR